MAIERVPFPNPLPTEQDDFVKQNNLLSAGFLKENGSVVPVVGTDVVKGATFNVGGTFYKCTADEAITGGASPYVKLSPSVDGATCSASYVANLLGVAWNSVFNGYYDGDGNLYVFNEALALIAGQIAAVVGRYASQTRDGDVIAGRDFYAGRDVLADQDVNATRDVIAERKVTCEKVDTAGTGTILVQQTGNGSQAPFQLKKPVTAFMKCSGGISAALHLLQDGSYRGLFPATTSEYLLQLNPGYYRLVTQANATVTLYCTGVFGAAAIAAADIVAF